MVKASYSHAVDDDLLRENPCTGVSLPSSKKAQEPFLGYDDTLKVIQALQDTPDLMYNQKVGILLGIMCGLRNGEICGIHESDINFEKRTITIQHARYKKKGGGTYEKLPKSSDSIRIVSSRSTRNAPNCTDHSGKTRSRS